MSNELETYSAKSGFKGFNIPANKLVVVGIDCPAEQRPELADPDRIRLPIDKDMVQNIIDNGIVDPVIIRKFKGDPNKYVVDGRRRVLHARKANEQLSKSNQILIPCVPDAKTDATITFTVGNEFRVDSTPLMKARHAGRLKNLGQTDDQIAAKYSVTKSLLKSLWWPILEAPAAAQKAVEDDLITATVCADIARTEPELQEQALADAIAAGKGQGASDAVKAVRLRKNAPKTGKGKDKGKNADAADAAEADSESDRVHRLGVKQVRAFAESLMPRNEEGEIDEKAELDGETALTVAVLAAVLGDTRRLKKYSGVYKVYKKLLAQ